MSRAFFGGLPTDMDIKRLRERWPDAEMKPGDKILYDAVAGVIGAKYRSSRFTSVTNQWRKVVERESNIILGTEPATAFVVLNESEKLDMSGQKLRMAGRAARRSWVVGSRIDRKQLSCEEARRLDHNVSVTAKIISSTQIRKPQIIPEM
ncbi:MAG: hypothetical protein AB7V04_07130 [Desulfomonilaceae bacterium]